MTAVKVTPLEPGLISIRGTDITIHITDKAVDIEVFGIPVKSAEIPEIKPGYVLAYADAWFNAVVQCPDAEGTTADIEPICDIPHWIMELAESMFDARNSVSCGAYSRMSAVDYWSKLYRDYVSRDIIAAILA